MTLLAALAIGVCCALVAARLVGQPVEFRRWPHAPRRGPSPQLWLQQAGIRVTPRQFVAGSAAVGLVAFAATYFLTGAALVAVVPACAAASIPRAYFGRRRMARLRELQAAWPDGLRDVVASVAAGRSLSHALTTLAETGPSALRDAFGRFPLLARMLGTVPALEIVKSDLADPTSDRVIEVLILAHERGGPIVRRILEDLVVATTKDLKVLDEIESEGLEMKINARAVLVMPWLVLVALTKSGFQYYRCPSSTGELAGGAPGAAGTPGAAAVGQVLNAIYADPEMVAVMTKGAESASWETSILMELPID